MHEKSLKTAKEWLSSPYDKTTQEKVKALIEEGGEELIESFYKELDFGTGGMRGIMGVGPNRINKYTIGKATQGLANTLISTHEEQDVSVAIAFDCRNNSNKLALNVKSLNQSQKQDINKAISGQYLMLARNRDPANN